VGLELSFVSSLAGVFMFLGCSISVIPLVNHRIPPLVIGDLTLPFL
jgi:hypothetical protein